MVSPTTYETDIAAIAQDEEQAVFERWSTTCVAGSLAVRTCGLLGSALGYTGRSLAADAAKIHQDTHDHGMRLAVMGLAVAEEFGLGLSVARQEEVVASYVFHDIGKTHRKVLPLVGFKGYFSAGQRAQMAAHTSYGKTWLHDAAGVAQANGNTQGARRLRFAANIAGNHHNYNMPLPKTSAESDVWPWVVATTAQVLDSADALTAGAKRGYLKARAAAEDGGAPPLDILDRITKERFSGERDAVLRCATGLTSREILEIGLFAKLDTCGALTL